MLVSLSSPTLTMSLTSFPPFSSSIPTKLPHFYTTTPLPFLHLCNNHHNQQYPPPKIQSFTNIALNNHLAKLPPRCASSNPAPVGEEERELQEGIIDILLGAGVSMEEAEGIAMGARKYGEMLLEGVRELDELSLWGSYVKEKVGGEMTHLPPFSLKEKVKCVAEEKGDYGKIAYLESVGLSLSSAVHLAGIVSSQSLPSLIHKVKYVKEIFFSGSDERQAGKVARRMMLHLSILVDEDVQQTLSFFEKIEARRGGLDMLGCCDASFRYLIESFPRLLLLSESHMTAVVKFLENVGVPKERMGNVFLLHPPLLFLDSKEDTRDRLWTYEKVRSLDKDFGKILVKYPWALSPSIHKNYKEIWAFFETKKVPKNSIDRAIRDWPLLLGCSADKLKPLVEHFDGLGVRTTKLGKVIATSPQLLLRKPEEFRKVISLLQDMGFDNNSIGKILARCPEIFAVRTVETLQQKLEFLTSFGILKQQCRVIKKYPEFFVSDIGTTVAPRLRYLMNWGLSKRDVASMVVRFSPLLGYSIDGVLKPKLEFLVNTMGKSVTDVVKYPRYFSYSLEKKIKPRFSALSGKSTAYNLEDMLSKNDEEFASDFFGGIEEMFVSVR